MSRVIGTDRVGYIEVGDGAMMSVPIGDWLWQLRYARPEPDRKGMCDDRMLAAGVLESYVYLVMECTKEEAWRRIKIMRAALTTGQTAGKCDD
jgi:hypothetical protein